MTKIIYIRVFCYQLFSIISGDFIDLNTLINDIEQDNVDLSLSAMRYSTKNSGLFKHITSLFIQKLHNKNWQIRAIAAKLLGEMHVYESLVALEPLLEDSVWWVSYNAACALYKLGSKGKEILEKQSLQNTLAYDVAQRVLNLKPQWN